MGQEAKQEQSAEERLHTCVAESESGGTLSFDLEWPVHLIERLFAEEAVVSDSLDVQKTSVGLKANLPQSGEILESLANIEVVGVVDGGVSAERTSFLVVLLDASAFVINVQRGGYALRDDPGPETSRRLPRHPAVEDQLNLARAADV
jgi:hypothetical protein